MEQYIAKAIGLRFWSKVHLMLAGLFDRTRVMKRFCSDIGIEYPPVRGKKYHMKSDSYVVDTDEIKNLDKSCDKILEQYYGEYVNIQNELELKILDNSQKLKEEQIFLDELREEKMAYKQKEKSAKDPSDKMAFQTKAGNLAAKIKNQTDAVNELSRKIDEAKTRIETNKASWIKQIENAETAIDLYKRRYTSSATKKIQNSLNFNDFMPKPIRHNEIVSKTMKGEYKDAKKQ
ncbi:hypothetical protein J6S35_02695 [Candidatus Saccharibacteria bacterium]|nr:hypothetical protein [Candidatus Saccharibacteria bacterium]